jgi:hypothetical protein
MKIQDERIIALSNQSMARAGAIIYKLLFIDLVIRGIAMKRPFEELWFNIVLVILYKVTILRLDRRNGIDEDKESPTFLKWFVIPVAISALAIGVEMYRDVMNGQGYIGISSFMALGILVLLIAYVVFDYFRKEKIEITD